ncbi:hypothetical protein [Proteiniphilum sp. X52]|uniref:hypothetical protein n=1 Tax=Proteiniphilum sp. X52 TaxID=2382159 RepID=UPI001314A05B|nr:hypothetical protein [Proteiniphilum sp. X52]
MGYRGQKHHTREDARENWTALCKKSMIHTTNWMERLNKVFNSSYLAQGQASHRPRR